MPDRKGRTDADSGHGPFNGAFDSLALTTGTQLRRASYFVGPVGGALVAWLLGYGPASGMWPFGVGAIGGLVIAGFQVAAGRLSALKSRLENAEETTALAEAVRPHNALALSLDPVLRTAAEVAPGSKTDREMAFGRLSQQLVDAIVAAYNDRSGLRSVLYELTEDDAGRGQLHVIAQQKNGNREDARDFTEGDPRGDSAIELVRDGKRRRYLYVEDLETGQPGDWHGTGERYRTFVSVVVLGESTPYGMITIDAPGVDDITEDDAVQMQLAAGVAAVLFAERGRTSRR